MKCKINGFGIPTEPDRMRRAIAFLGTILCFSVTYTDKKTIPHDRKKSTSLKIKAAELNVLLGVRSYPSGRRSQLLR